MSLTKTLQQIFSATFVQNIETRIKSDGLINALMQLIHQKEYLLQSCKVVIPKYNFIIKPPNILYVHQIF